MTSARVAYDPTTKMGKKVALFAQFGIQFRQYAGELTREMEAYVDDNATLGVDTGLSTAAATALRTQVAEAAAEMTGLALVTINSGSATVTKALLDDIG